MFRLKNTIPLAVAVACILAAQMAPAQNVTWTSNATGNWSDTTKWLGGTAPTNGGTFNFFFENPTNGQNPVATNDLTGITASGISMLSTLPARDTTLAGNAITLAGNVTVTTGNWQTINLDMALSSGTRFFNISSGRLTVAGNLTGTGTLQKEGGATLILSGTNNTYSGNTTINGGQVVVSSKTGLGSTGSTVTFNAGSGTTLELATSDGVLTNTYNLNMGSNRFNTIVINRASAGAASYALGNFSLGSSTMTFNRGGNISGTGSVSIGILDLSSGNNDRPVILNGNATISVASAGIFSNNGISKRLQLDGSASNNTIGVISNGSGAGLLSVIKEGTSTWTLSAVNTFTGGTTVGNGTLTLNNGGGAGAIRGTATVNAGGTILSTFGDSFGYNNGTKVNTLNIVGGNLTHNNANNLTLSTATVNMTGGLMQSTGVGGFDIYDNGSGNTVINTLASATTATIAGKLNLRQGDNDAVGTVFTVADGGAATDLEVSAVIANGSFQSANSIVQKSGDGLMLLSGNNSYTGGTILNAGTLAVNSNTSLGASSGNITFAGNSTLATTANIVSSRNYGINASVNATIDTATSTTLTNNGVISGAGNLIKAGLGTLALGGNNSLSGATVINSGRIQTTAADALRSTSAISVASGATLEVAAGNSINDAAAVSLAGGTILRGAGVSETFGALTLTSNSFIDFGATGTGTLNFNTYSGASNKLAVTNFRVGSVLTFKTDLSGSITNTSLFTFDSGFTSSWNSGTDTFTITAVPEPSTIIAGILFLGLVCYRERRRIPTLFAKAKVRF